ncbi:uncharacterized protein [Battus philenor]|uniref:uncharacterized protein n=1 Tax=Battus philenor TaxID=42288 RepID=UPI0035D0D5CB
MKGEKCTFGTRIAIDIHMLNEIIYREVKHFRNYKIYRPNFGSIPVTGKFYAAHSPQDDSEEQIRKVEHYINKVSEARAKGPHSKYPTPVTTSHIYGWYTKPVYPMDRQDRRFYQPKRESPNTKVEVLILMANPRSKKSDKPATPTAPPAPKKKEKS